MKSASALCLVVIVAVSLLFTVPAWAIHYASGYKVIADGGCTVASAGDICTYSFNDLPTEARLNDSTILWFVIDCSSGADFDLQVKVNGTSERSFGSLSGTSRGMWEVIGGGRFVTGTNLVEFVANGDDTGSCTIQDVILQYRLNTVP